MRAEKDVWKWLLFRTRAFRRLKEGVLKGLRKCLSQVIEFVVEVGTRFSVENAIQYERLEVVFMLVLRSRDLTLFFMGLRTGGVLAQHAAVVFVKPTARAMRTV